MPFLIIQSLMYVDKRLKNGLYKTVKILEVKFGSERLLGSQVLCDILQYGVLVTCGIVILRWWSVMMNDLATFSRVGLIHNAA
jgi:hypothetical protein